MRKFPVVIVLCLLAFVSCRLKDKVWDVNVLTPLLQTSLSMSDLIKDSLLKEEADQSLSFVKELQLADLNIGEVLHIPDTTIKDYETLKTINLGRREIGQDISLGTIAQNAGLAGQIIIFNNGKKMVLPPVNNISSGPLDISAESLFESATFIDGKLEMKITNGLPVALTDIDFELRNKQSGSIIVKDFIPILNPGATFDSTYSLAGKTIEGEMVAEVLNMNTPGSNGDSVLIDTSDALQVRMLAYDMKVHHATAIFPSQNVVNDSSYVYYNMGDAELKLMHLKSGNLEINTYHNIDADMFLHYELPDAKKGGVSIKVDETLKAAVGSNPSVVEKDYPLEGYTIDLTGGKDSFNIFFNVLVLRIDSTGEMKYLSLDDSIYFDYGLYNIVPEYAQGYLGQMTYETGPQTIYSNFNEIFKNGEIALDDLIITLDVMNGIGAPGMTKVKSLTAKNTKTGQTKQLTGTVINDDIQIAKATDQPFKQSLTTIQLNKTNSNIHELVGILPDVFIYELEVHINPQGNTKAYQDFIYHDSKVSANLNVELPLFISAQGIVLEDTILVEETEQPLERRASVKADPKVVTVTVETENYFPIEAAVQLYAMDADMHITDSILIPGENIIHAGVIDGATQRVLEPAKDKIMFTISKDQWDRISQQKSLIVKVKLNTVPEDQKVKIYSSYKVNVKVSANAGLRATVKPSTL